MVSYSVALTNGDVATGMVDDLREMFNEIFEYIEFGYEEAEEGHPAINQIWYTVDQRAEMNITDYDLQLAIWNR